MTCPLLLATIPSRHRPNGHAVCASVSVRELPQVVKQVTATAGPGVDAAEYQEVDRDASSRKTAIPPNVSQGLNRVV